jgi:nucleotide-binding universal stress UspA family protein
MSSIATDQLMQALTTRLPADAPALESLLIAIDGSVESDAPLVYARVLGGRSGASLRALSVCEPLPLVNTWPSLAPVYVAEDVEQVQAVRRAAADEQVHRMLGTGSGCDVTVRSGDVGPTIAAYASEIGADLIITGRGRHGVVDRLLGEEHLAALLRITSCPVLALESPQQQPFRRLTIGVDFSERGMHTARTAARLADDYATIYLVHVKPDPPFGMPHPGQWLKSYDAGVRAGLERFRAELALPPSITVEPIVINGHPGVALAEFARRSDGDLLAVGVHGAGFFNRLVIGSVTTYLLRAARCSLLVVPAPV